jgi:hypothetical protein
MTAPDPINDLFELADQLRELAKEMSAGQVEGMRAARVVQFAAAAVPGAQHAGISIIRGDQAAKTLVATDRLPVEVDRLQFETGEGPSVQALVQSDIVWTTDLAEDRTWPNFAPRVIEQTGVRSMLSYRLYLTDAQRGALNFYAEQPDAMGELAVGIGAVFASYASLTMLNDIHEDKAMHLSRALESNREIGLAIGILMARELCTQEQAFNQLRSASQHLNRKLRDIAEFVKHTGALPDLG